MRLSPVKNTTWKKNWAANWGFLVCNLYAPIYPVIVKKFLGKGIKTAILLFENGSSSNYLPEVETTGFGKYLAKRIVARPSLAKEWVKKVMFQTDEYTRLLNSLLKRRKFSLGDFKLFEQGMYNHVPPNLAVKKVADFLPVKSLNKFMPDFEKARVYTENVYNQVDKAGKKIQSFIAKQSGLPKKLALVLTKEEIKRYFMDNTLPGRKSLIPRTRGALFFATESGYKIFTGKQKSFYTKLVSKPAKRKNLEGSPAYKGLVRGIVRVVLDPKNVRKFDQGNILVTGMTRPEFLPLMKKAGAFVTDSGGMLSHAAILARELKKPCVIGTEIATKVFKNGDMVEVDADKGMVKKIR